ncbi:hypothetical protein UlMin_000970 [Ulmus minor]
MANNISPARTSPSKRIKLTHHNHHQPLLPGLPDHLAQLCLSPLHPSLLYSVCRSWRRLIYSPSFPPFLSLYAIFSSENHQTGDGQPNFVQFQSFDPISSNWDVLPTPKSEPPLRLLLRHPSFMSRSLPVQSVSVAGNLVLLAATSDNFFPALSRPLVFDPLSRKWVSGPPLSVPRRWCAAGTLRGAVYVASGIGYQFSHDVARSVERWDFQQKTKKTQNCQEENSGWEWEKVTALKDGKFSRDAIDAVGWRGKLCLVNVKGKAAKDGIVYNLEKDAWEEMPEGMINGWIGPVAAMDEEEMFVVDEAKGALRKYDSGRDFWGEIISSDRLKGAEQIAAGGGRVCVICGAGGEKEIVVVDVVAAPARTARLWVVDMPAGVETEAIHILPRMSCLELSST